MNGMAWLVEAVRWNETAHRQISLHVEVAVPKNARAFQTVVVCSDNGSYMEISLRFEDLLAVICGLAWGVNVFVIGRRIILPFRTLRNCYALNHESLLRLCITP